MVTAPLLGAVGAATTEQVWGEWELSGRGIPRGQELQSTGSESGQRWGQGRRGAPHTGGGLAGARLWGRNSDWPSDQAVFKWALEMYLRVC